MDIDVSMMVLVLQVLVVLMLTVGLVADLRATRGRSGRGHAPTFRALHLTALGATAVILVLLAVQLANRPASGVQGTATLILSTPASYIVGTVVVLVAVPLTWKLTGRPDPD